MKKIGIICNLMTSYGGVQTCVISLIKGLNQKGITPILISDSPPIAKLWEEHGLTCDVQKVNFSISAKSFDRFRKVLMPVWEFVFYFRTSWLKEDYDFLYIFQPNTIVDSDQEHLFYLSMSPRANNFTSTPFLTKLKNGFYSVFLKRFHPIFEFQNYNCVINSNYTAKMFYEYFSKKIEVIYPSNSVEEFVPKSLIKKDKTVVFLSRIAADKKVEKVLELAKVNTDYNFYILGAVNEYNMDYFSSLNKKVITGKIQNVELLVNLPYSEIINYLSFCEYYTFFAENEHFGITTVEAILFECIPYVHNSGGQREIVPNSILRFDYNNMIEKFNQLTNLNASDKQKIKDQLKDHISTFKEDVFIRKMLRYIA